MTDAPETIWAVHGNTEGAVVNGAWADTIRYFCGGIEYRRADLVAPAPAKVTLGFLRPIWKDHSGEWHGPKVERWSIPEDQMVTFFNAALRAIAGGRDD